MSYALSPCLGDSTGGKNPCYGTTGLFGEINKRYPNRDHSSDGWIGDASHAARPSDHNPNYGGKGKYYGLVHAIDIDSNGAPGELTQLVKDVLNAAIGDPRVYYVIFNRKIYSRTYGWVARAYTGSNPHDHHVHVSILTNSGEFNLAGWLEAPPYKVVPKPVSLPNVRAQFILARDGKSTQVNNGVARVQKVLVNQYGAKLRVDGLAGRATLDAWGAWENTHPEFKKGGARIPDDRSLPAFAKGRFRVVGLAKR